MESLVHYETLLVRRHCAVLGDEECERLKANTLELLRQLEVLDPLRKQRYRDLGERNVHHESYRRFDEETRFVYSFLGHSINCSIKSMTLTTILFAQYRTQGW